MYMHCKIIYAKTFFAQQYRFFIPEVRGLFLKNSVSGGVESGAVALPGEVDILYYVYMCCNRKNFLYVCYVRLHGNKSVPSC